MDIDTSQQAAVHLVYSSAVPDLLAKILDHVSTIEEDHESLAQNQDAKQLRSRLSGILRHYQGRSRLRQRLEAEAEEAGARVFGAVLGASLNSLSKDVATVILKQILFPEKYLYFLLTGQVSDGLQLPSGGPLRGGPLAGGGLAAEGSLLSLVGGVGGVARGGRGEGDSGL